MTRRVFVALGRVVVALALLVVLAAPSGPGTEKGALPAIAVVQLPDAASSTNLKYTVYDSLTGDCLTGGGSMVVDCISNGSAWVPLAQGGTEFVLWQGRLSDTVSAPECAHLARGPSTAVGAILISACNAPETNLYATHNLVVTRMAATLQAPPASGDGCDVQLQIAGVAQGTDADNWLDIGSAGLDAAGETQTLVQNVAVAAGQRIEVGFISAAATQCIAGSGCDCTGPTGAQALYLWIYGRSQ